MPAQRKRAALLLAGFILAALLGYWTLQRVDLMVVLQTLRKLRLWQILALLIFNLGIVGLFSFRWWWILRLQGIHIPFRGLLLYRLSGFGLSYFTPGPQFGGEPWQVYFLYWRHAVPLSTGAASVALDKLMELLANFSFLAFGILTALQWGFFRLSSVPGFGLPMAGVLSLPLLILLALRFGILPATYLIRRFPSAPGVIRRGLSAFARAEQASADTLRNHSGAVAFIVLYSLLVWAAMLGEYWLTLWFFGVELGLSETVLALTAARLAFLTPIPGGLGALEASQTLAFQALGLEGSVGLSLSLFIRARDILFASAGLWLGSVFTAGKRQPPKETSLERETTISTKESE